MTPKATTAKAAQEKPKGRPKGSTNRPFPAASLEEALVVPKTIKESNAGKPMNRLLLAEAMSLRPNGDKFRNPVAAAAKYGLTTGSYSATTIGIMDLGTTIVSPRNASQEEEGKRSAFLNIPIFKDLLDHFSNNKLPSTEFLKNILEEEPFSIDARWSLQVAEAFKEDAEFLGYIRDISGSTHVIVDGSPLPDDSDGEPVAASADIVEGEQPELGPQQDRSPQEAATAAKDQPIQFFIAHGKNHTPLTQLEGFLKSMGIPYLVAKNEPDAGRPISQKVAETMKKCSAGIFIFTADEEFKDAKGEPVRWPNLNVVYELGAASYIYGRKIVIFREAGVTFPSDFSDLGRITFEKDALKDKTGDLMRELMGLGARLVM